MSISVVGLLLTGAIPLFPTGEAGGAGLPPLLLDSFHLWDFNIKDINGKYWKYEARTDLYSVKFPVDIDGDSAELEVFGGKYALKMIVNDLECTDFDGRENGTFFLEDPLEDEPVVDGVTITYPDIYDDIDLEYEICYDQCKETFIIKNLSNSIHGNLMFNNTIEYNVSALRVFCGGE